MAGGLPFISGSARQPSEPPRHLGIGVWNDPFSMGILNKAAGGRKTTMLRLPALPDAAWFFYASPPSYLSLRDDLPAQGWLAVTFQAKRLPVVILAPLIIGFPLLFFPPGMRLVRRALSKVVQQDATLLKCDPSEWHQYALSWETENVTIQLDGQNVLETSAVPQSRLGLVIWLDNQYMALSPDGRIGYGMLPNLEPAWIEIRNLEIYRR